MKPEEDQAKTSKMPDNPIPGTGKRSVSDLCRTYGLDPKMVMKGFVDHNIQETADMNLKEIGTQNNVGPHEIYDIIKKTSEIPVRTSPMKAVGKVAEEKTPKRGTPSGLGRKTVAEVCRAYGIDQAQALKKLAAKGITAGADDKIKRLAEKHDLLPINLYEIMK